VSTATLEARTWRRFTPAQRLARFAVYLAMVTAIVVSIQNIEVIPEFLLDAPEQMADLFKRMWPIAFAYYPKGVHEALIETLHIATLGTIMAAVMAFPIGLMAANNITPSRTLNAVARLLLVSSRSVNSLVWALLFVAIFGPGALAFPERGVGVEQTRERLQKLGLDPNALRPNPAKLERVRLEAMLKELHRAGVLTDDELADKLAGLQRDPAGR